MSIQYNLSGCTLFRFMRICRVHELGIPDEHAMPEGAADAFKARLTIGEGNNTVVYPLWEGALEEDSKLLKLIRLLEMI